MKTTILCAMLVLSCISTSPTSLRAQETKLPTRAPSASANAAIERFIAECVSITPGEDGFSKRFISGTKEPTAHETTQQEVAIEHPFRISKYEVTQELYEAVTGTNPSRWKGPRNSVENVSCTEAVLFCQQLTELLSKKQLIGDAQKVRLPTYVEWEYCCRAGTETRYCFGQNAGPEGLTTELDAYAWHTGNAAGNDPAVGVLKPNSWGLFDVHGYLWEFVSHESGQNSLQITAPAAHCIIRGGSWRDAHPLLSSSAYLTISESERSDAIGFRCVIAEKPEVKISLMR